MQRTLLLVLALLIPLVAVGQPIATISTSGPLIINGTPVPVAGIPSWPLAAGDEIATGSSSASILFPDGSVVTIGKDGKAKIGKSSVDLLAGMATYKAASVKSLELRASGRPVDLKAQPEGIVSIEGPERAVVRSNNGRDPGVSAPGKYKKPKPRSGHEKDDDDDDVKRPQQPQAGKQR